MFQNFNYPSLALASLALFAPLALGDNVDGAVYAMTNAAANSVAAYDRSPDGVLTYAGTFLTNGRGTAQGLGSQGALALSADGRWLVAVNAASDEVTVFSTATHGLRFRSITPSGGQMPVSVTIAGDLVYVLNAGSNNIAGFRMDRAGRLRLLAGSIFPLTGHGPAQIGFSADAGVLVVTGKASDTIESFRMENGLPHGPVVAASAGQTPFGFGFDLRDHLIVSEAFGAAAGRTAVSSYNVSETAMLTPATRSLASGQTAACWITVTHNGKYAYAANTPSATLSGYMISRAGMLSLIASVPVAATLPAGSAPTDMAVSMSDEFLYTLNSGNGSIGSYRINAGMLEYQGAVGALPSGAAGIAAR